jgi:tetratricopeptide (TPR) repeat protein
MGNSSLARDGFQTGTTQPVDNVFSFRTDAIEVFETALSYNPRDGGAHYYLGLVYAKMGDLEKAITHWEKSVQLTPENPRAWRNLGLAIQHNEGDSKQALKCYEKAFALAPDDSRILLELDDVRRQLEVEPMERLSLLKQHRATVESRDDLLKSMLDLMIQAEEYEEALEYFNTHHFKLWEGRYDIHNAFIEANLALARSAETPEESLRFYQRACQFPENLEVAPREPNLRGFLYYPMALLQRELGNEEEALRLLDITANETSDAPTLGSYYQALALRDLGKKQRAESIMSELRMSAHTLLEGEFPGYRWENANLQKALGLFYLSKLAEASGNGAEASDHLLEARKLEPMIERQAINMAQLVYARAHQ